MAALDVELVQAQPSTGDARAGDLQSQRAAAQAELDHLQHRAQSLAVRAGVAGRLALPRAADLPGQFLRRGSLLGQVLTAAPPTVRVALPEAEASALRAVDQPVSVRLAAAPAQAIDATLQRDSVGAVMQLPSAALSQRHGGPVVTDPRDGDDLKPVQPVVLLDVQLGAQPGGSGTARIGERAWVRFDAGLSPLALQPARGLQRAVAAPLQPAVLTACRPTMPTCCRGPGRSGAPTRSRGRRRRRTLARATLAQRAGRCVPSRAWPPRRSPPGRR